MIDYADDILFCLLNQFALMIFFDIFNKTVHKANITIFNIDYNFVVHNSYFLSTFAIALNEFSQSTSGQNLSKEKTSQFT